MDADDDKKIQTELLIRLKEFSDNYIPNKTHRKNKNINYNNSPISFPKTTIFDKLSFNAIQKLSIYTNINSRNKLYRIISQLKNDYKKYFHEKISSSKRNKQRFSPNLKKAKKINDYNKFKDYYKSQDKPIKKNFVNQKFKIADDFNEENSKKFLNEKDEYLREIILSDKIEKEETISSYSEDERERLFELSPIRRKEFNDCQFSKTIKGKKVKDDSIKFLSELIKNLE